MRMKPRRGAPPTQSLGLAMTDFVSVSELIRQELVILICFGRKDSAASRATAVLALRCISPTLFFSVFLVCGDMLTCTLKGLWQVCEQKIVPKPLTKVSLNSGALAETMNSPGYICGTPVPLSTSAPQRPAWAKKLRNATVPPVV